MEQSRAHCLLAASDAHFAVAELDATDIAGDCSGRVEELDPPDSLVGSEVIARVDQDAVRGLIFVGPADCGQHDVRLRHRESQLVGGGARVWPTPSEEWEGRSRFAQQRRLRADLGARLSASHRGLSIAL